MRYVIVPGIDDSDNAHWQSRWQADWGSAAARIRVASWAEPDLADWERALDEAVGAVGDEPAVVVAHSLGCLAATSWATKRGGSAAASFGLFLVAPPDPRGDSFPTRASSFSVDSGTVPTPAIVVCSDNDPYSSPAATVRMSRLWRVPYVSVGAAGHLNSASGLGHWDVGRNLLTAFIAGSGSCVGKGLSSRHHPTAPEVIR